MTPGRGRPRSTSVADIEEAAVELFLEQGYEATSIDDIARRAGISRSAFFGYVSAKSDLLWHDVDAALRRIALVTGMSRGEVGEALAHAVEPWGDRVPSILRDAPTTGTGAVLRQTVVDRLEHVVDMIAQALEAREGAAASHLGAAFVAVAVSAVTAWAAQGRDRGTASDAVRAATAVLG